MYLLYMAVLPSVKAYLPLRAMAVPADRQAPQRRWEWPQPAARMLAMRRVAPGEGGTSGRTP